MLKTFRKILFTTDLSQNAWHSFAFALSLAAHYRAEIVILHVLKEVLPRGYNSLLSDLLGEHYETLVSQRKDQAHSILIGKQKQAHLIQRALQEWFEQRILESGQTEPQSLIADILVKQGQNVPEDIVFEAKDNGCDLIVMGMNAWRRLFQGGSTSTISQVIERSGLPVLAAPLPDSE